MVRMNMPLALSVALGLASVAPARADPPVLAGTRLDVGASGEVTRLPDIATLSAGVVTQAGSAAAAMADNARRMAAATAALRKAGIADKDIRTAALSLQPQYRYADNQPPVITGYQASNQLSVTFRDIGKAGVILDTLVAQGVNQIGGPDFAVEHPEGALDEARTQAIRTAQARARLYAAATGLSVKRIVAISESGGDMPQPRPMMMLASRAKSADTELAPGSQTLSVAVQVTFELQ